MEDQIIHLSEVCDVEILRSYPQGDVEILACPVGSRPGAPFGMILHVTHEEGDWHCHFVADGSDVCGVFPLSPRIAVAIADGLAYYVPVYEPGRCSELPCGVVKQVEAIPSLSLLVVADGVAVFGIGPEGLRWQTRRLAWDGITILSASADSVTGVAQDSSNLYVEFTVDPRTGQHQGGCSTV